MIDRADDGVGASRQGYHGDEHQSEFTHAGTVPLRRQSASGWEADFRPCFAPTVIVTDKLRSYGAALQTVGVSGRHEQDLRANNRAENSHQPVTRKGGRVWMRIDNVTAHAALSTLARWSPRSDLIDRRETAELFLGHRRQRTLDPAIEPVSDLLCLPHLLGRGSSST
jgi:hypothetical protein